MRSSGTPPRIPGAYSTVYAQTENDAPKSHHGWITTDDVARANIAHVMEPCRCTMMMALMVRLRISWMGRRL
jgi:ABC-type microcin C transport system permease subunit YejE